VRIAYAGTPAFAAAGLAALIGAGHDICLALTQPDRPAGRGQRVQPGAVRQLALEHGIEVLSPTSLRPERGGPATLEALARLRAAAPDLLVVAAYGLLLPEAVLQLPRGVLLPTGPVTAVNIHASLLPRWRGAAPIVRAIEAGDAQTGVTIMQMDAGLDTGPMLASERVQIGADQTAGELTTQLAERGGDLLVRTLAAMLRGEVRAQAQPDQGISYAHKLAKQEAWLDWDQPAATLAARIRAFDPFPGACSGLHSQVIKFWRAQALPGGGAPLVPGTVLAVDAGGIDVACGQGVLRLVELQRPGGRRLPVREFLAGFAVTPGARWSSAVPVPGTPHAS